MDDQFRILDCALQSGYTAPAASPTLPIWKHLPEQLCAAVTGATAVGATLKEISKVVWRVRAELHGKPESDTTGEMTRAYARLRLGLHYLAYRERRLGVVELLTQGWFVADSYYCEVDPRPFLRLRAELEAGKPVEDRVAALFAPYVEQAAQCVERWGLQVARSETGPTK